MKIIDNKIGLIPTLRTYPDQTDLKNFETISEFASRVSLSLLLVLLRVSLKPQNFDTKHIQNKIRVSLLRVLQLSVDCGMQHVELISHGIENEVTKVLVRFGHCTFNFNFGSFLSNTFKIFILVSIHFKSDYSGPFVLSFFKF